MSHDFIAGTPAPAAMDGAPGSPGALGEDDHAAARAAPAVSGAACEAEERERARQFEELALPLIADIGRFALSLTRDRTDADDLVQETYLQAFRYWNTFDPSSDPRRWLFTICRNTFARSRRRKEPIVDEGDGDVDAMPSVMSHVAATREGLGRLFDEIDVGPAIGRAVGALPEPYRSALILVDLEGQRYEEAAAVLQVPVGTVRSRLFRARRAVQAALIEHARDAGIARAPARRCEP